MFVVAVCPEIVLPVLTFTPLLMLIETPETALFVPAFLIVHVIFPEEQPLQSIVRVATVILSVSEDRVADCVVPEYPLLL